MNETVPPAPRETLGVVVARITPPARVAAERIAEASETAAHNADKWMAEAVNVYPDGPIERRKYYVLGKAVQARDAILCGKA